MKYERVYTIIDWYDGPRLGVADYNGIPHVYKSAWDDKEDDWADYYYLKPIDKNSLSLILEEWEIWQKWDSAFKEGKVKSSPDHVLPEDEERYKELKILLVSVYEIDLLKAKRAYGDFQVSEIQESFDLETEQMIVKWEEIK